MRIGKRKYTACRQTGFFILFLFSFLFSFSQEVYFVPNFNSKLNLLKYLLKDENRFAKVIVFCKTKKIATALYEQLKDSIAEESLRLIHGNKEQQTRINAMNAFKNEEVRLLITTDVAARGLDTIFLAAPTSPDERLTKIAASTSGFLYVISRTGVTGAKDTLPEDLRLLGMRPTASFPFREQVLAEAAILYPGELGAGLGAVLAERGLRVVTTLIDRGPRTAGRCNEAGIEVLATFGEVVRAANLVISLVPPAAAEEVAEAYCRLAIGKNSVLTTTVVPRMARPKLPKYL